MRYLKVCKNVDILFNLSYKLTFYCMWFTRYMIVANSAIFSLYDIIKTLFQTPPPMLVARHFLRVYSCFSHAKSFSYSKNLKSISIFSLHYFMSLANFNFSISHLKKTLSCSFKYFKSSDVIVVKKKSLSEVY